MKILRSDELPALPTEVKVLVRDGVYALYRLREETHEGGRYVLMTRGKEFYVLSAVGDIVAPGEVRDPSRCEFDGAATFTSGPGFGPQLNRL